MQPEILSEMSWSFAGKPPNVPLSSELEIEEWRHAEGNDADPANRPMFVTLPLLRVGTRSRNGLDWDKPSAMHVVNEINTKRPGGNLGHLPAEKRSTDYKLPVLRWLGAMLDEQSGLVWAKAYVPKYAQDVREFMTDAKRARAKVGVSLYGMRGEKGLSDMTLEQVDLGHEDRISHPDAAAVPIITSEMQNSTNENKTGEDNNPMPEKDELQLVSELSADKTKALQQVSELTSKLTERDTLVSELKKRDEGLKEVEKLVAEFAGSTIAEKIGKLVSELSDLRKVQKKSQIEGWIAEALKAVELADLHPVIIAEMGEIDSEANAKARVQELMGKEHIKVIAEALAEKHMGPRAFVGSTDKKDGGRQQSLKELNKPETIAEARAWAGL